MHSRRMLELDVLEVFDQSFDGSSVRHGAYPFQRESSIDLFDDKFRILLHLEPAKSHL